MLIFDPVTSHRPFLCFPLETNRKEQKFQTSSSVVAQLGFSIFFFLIWDWRLVFLVFKSATEDLFIISIISSSNGTVLWYGHSFCACVLKIWPNLWVNAVCKGPCWLQWVFLLDVSKKLNSDGANHLAENQFFAQVCPCYRTVLGASSYNFDLTTSPVMMSLHFWFVDLGRHFSGHDAFSFLLLCMLMLLMFLI